MGLGKALIDLGRTNSDKKIRLDELGEDLKNIYQNRLANGLPQMGQLGKKTVVGAGSVITKNVKDKSLALTRAKQIEVKNYKRK